MITFRLQFLFGILLEINSIVLRNYIKIFSYYRNINVKLKYALY